MTILGRIITAPPNATNGSTKPSAACCPSVRPSSSRAVSGVGFSPRWRAVDAANRVRTPYNGKWAVPTAGTTTDVVRQEDRSRPTTEGSSDLGEAAAQALLAQIHGHVAREGDRLVAVFRGQIAGAQVEVLAHGALNILDAESLGAMREGR